MRVLFIRHAWARDRVKFAAGGKADGMRPLTARGIRRMQQVAQDLKLRIPRFGLLATSPLVRAQQTAEILSDVYDDFPVTSISELEPGSAPDVLSAWLKRYRGEYPVALVGHEPDLSDAIAWFLTGSGDGSFIKMKKGQVCCLDMPPACGPGSSVLRWSLAPMPVREAGA